MIHPQMRVQPKRIKMKLDLNAKELNLIARGLIMIEKSVGRKMKDADVSVEMSAVLTKEQNEVYVLRQKLALETLKEGPTKTA